MVRPFRFATNAVTPALVHDYKLGSLEITHLWTRATPATAKSAGGYLVITNKGTVPDRLVTVRNPVLEAEVHEMKTDGSVMRMRELPNGLEIPPGASVALKPGGYHIMFMGLAQPLVKGTTVPVTLVFEKAGSIDVQFVVEALGAAQPSH